MTERYEQGKRWFSIGRALRVTCERFRCWVLVIEIGTHGIAIPAWPYRSPRR